MNTNENKQLGLTEYAAIVWRRRNTAMLAAGLFACLSLIAFNFVPRKYSAKAVFERRGDVIAARVKNMPESFENKRPMMEFELIGEQAIRTALEDLGYVDGLKMGLSGELSPEAAGKLGALVASLHRNLRASWQVRGQDVDRVSVSMTCTDPVLTYALPNQLVENYIEKTRKEIVEQLRSSATFLQEQVDAAEAEVADLTAQRYSFLKGHPGMLPEDPQILNDRILRASDEIEDLQLRRKELTESLTSLNALLRGEGLGHLAGNTAPNPEYEELSEAVRDLRGEIEFLRQERRMTDRHPRMMKLKQALQDARDRLATVPPTLAVPMHQSQAATVSLTMKIKNMENEVKSVDLSMARARKRLESLKTAQANFMPLAQEYQELSDRILAAQNEAGLWRKHLADVQMSLEAEQNGSRTLLSIVQPARRVYRPSWPSLWHVFLVSFGGGVAFGCALAIILESIGHCFETVKSARDQIGLPVLGVIGPIYSPAVRRIRAIRRYVLAPAGVAMLLLVMLIAAAGVVISAQNPGKYARIMEHFTPLTRAMWNGVQGLWGMIS